MESTGRTKQAEHVTGTGIPSGIDRHAASATRQAVTAPASTSLEGTMDARAELSADMLAALKRYATTHGRRWKSALNEDWMRATYSGVSDDDASALQRARNQFGPSWLVRFRLAVQS